jgi:uncharacterized membrane protein
MNHLVYHPFFASLPLGIFVTAFVCELFCSLKLVSPKNEKFTLVLQITGSIVVIIAFISGYIAASYASQTFKVPENDIALHHRSGKVVLVSALLVTALSYIRRTEVTIRPSYDVVYWILYVILIIGLLTTGYLGAYLVFVHGAGVKLKT